MLLKHRPSFLFSVMNARLTLLVLISALKSLLGQDSPSAPTLPGLPPEIAKVIDSAPKAHIPLLAAEPLKCAVEMSRLISGDDDKAFEYQYLICKAYMEAGLIEEALDLAKSMADYRSSLTLLSVAEHTLKMGGDRAQAIQLIKTVETNLTSYKPWQQEVVRGRLYLAGEMLEWQSSSLKEILDKVTDKGVLAGVRCLSQIRKQIKSSTIEAKSFENLLKAIDEPTPELLVGCREVLDLVHQRLMNGNLAEAESLISLAIQIADSSKVQHVDVYLEYAAIYVKAGFEPQGMKLYRACKQRFGGDTEDVARTQFLLAHLWQVRGKGSEMKQLLEPFEAKIRGLGKMYRPYGLAWIAAAWRVIGEAERADLCINAAAKDAETNINPRMRFLGSIDICLSYAKIKRSLESSLIKSMERIREGNVTPVIE